MATMMTMPSLLHGPLIALAALAAIDCSSSSSGDTGESSSSGPDAQTDPVPTTGTNPSDTGDTGVDPTSPTSDGSSSSTGPDCPANTPPAAPTVVSPEPGRIDITAANLAISGTAFMDADAGDVLGGVGVEIWRVRDGVAAERVWHAELDGPAPPAIGLADGTFDDPDDSALEAWEDHAVRMRHRDEHAECSAWGPWSADLVFRTDDGSTALFDDSLVRDFYLDIPPGSWEAINAEANPPGCVPFDRSYYRGTLRFEDQTFPGVGIKIKGGCGSSRDLNGKASFKVNLEWDDPALPGCPGERRLMGEKHFTFNNGVQDSSASHERVGYSYFRDVGMPTPRIASVRLFVNDELFGVYQHVETIDRRFLARWFPTNDGMLYEGTYWCDLVSGNLPPTDDDDSKCLTREFKPDPCTVVDDGADPLDYSVLRAMITAVEAIPDGEFYPAITQIFDWDMFLTTWAAESVIAHWDNYAFDIKNNYRVYHDPTTGLWTLISTGIDQTFNQEQDPWGAEGVLAVRCLQDPDCEAAYAAKIAEVNDLFESTDMAGRAVAVYTQISPFVMEDPRKEYDFATFQNRHQDLLNFIAARPDQIRQWLMDHGF